MCRKMADGAGNATDQPGKLLRPPTSTPAISAQLEMGLLRLRQGQYQGFALEGDALKVSRRIYEMADEYRQEVRGRSQCMNRPTNTAWQCQALGQGTVTSRFQPSATCANACASASQQACQSPDQLCWHLASPPSQVEDACNLAWFLGDECFEELKERSKDTRGMALSNFMSSDAFRSVFTSRE